MTLSNNQFTQLYLNHENALNSFALKLTRDPSSAQDLVQETAMKAFKGKHNFKSGTNFKSWAFTILKNTFISKYHRNKKRNVVNAPIEEITIGAESKFAVTNKAEGAMIKQEIDENVAALSYKCRLPFEMHTQGYQYDEIAEDLNIPIGTVKSRINYARTKLKEKLKEFYIK